MAIRSALVRVDAQGTRHVSPELAGFPDWGIFGTIEADDSLWLVIYRHTQTEQRFLEYDPVTLALRSDTRLDPRWIDPSLAEMDPYLNLWLGRAHDDRPIVAFQVGPESSDVRTGFATFDAATHTLIDPHVVSHEWYFGHVDRVRIEADAILFEDHAFDPVTGAPIATPPLYTPTRKWDIPYRYLSNPDDPDNHNFVTYDLGYGPSMQLIYERRTDALDPSRLQPGRVLMSTPGQSKSEPIALGGDLRATTAATYLATEDEGLHHQVLDADRWLMAQVILQSPNPSHPRGGLLRLGLLTPASTEIEWIGWLPLPQELHDLGGQFWVWIDSSDTQTWIIHLTAAGPYEFMSKAPPPPIKQAWTSVPNPLSERP